MKINLCLESLLLLDQRRKYGARELVIQELEILLKTPLENSQTSPRLVSIALELEKQLLRQMPKSSISFLGDTVVGRVKTPRMAMSETI